MLEPKATKSEAQKTIKSNLREAGLEVPDGLWDLPWDLVSPSWVLDHGLSLTKVGSHDVQWK